MGTGAGAAVTVELPVTRSAGRSRDTNSGEAPSVSVADLASLVELDQPVISADGASAAVVQRTPAGQSVLLTPVSPGPGGPSGPVAAARQEIPLRWPSSGLCFTSEGAALIVAGHDGAEAVLLVVPVGESVRSAGKTVGPVGKTAARTVRLPEEVTTIRGICAAPDQPGVVYLWGVAAEAADAGPAGAGPAGDVARPGIWRVDTGSGRSARIEHPSTVGEVRAMTVAPDGARAAVSVDGDAGTGTLRVVDLATGALLRTLCTHASRPTSRDRTLEFSPDGRTVLFSHGGDQLGHRLATVPATGGPVRLVIPDDDVTVLAAQWFDGHRVIAHVVGATRAELVVMDGKPVDRSPGDRSAGDESAGATKTGGKRHRTVLSRIGSGRPGFALCRERHVLVAVAGAAGAPPDLVVQRLTDAPAGRHPSEPAASAAGQAARVDTVRRLTDANPWARNRRTGAVQDVSWSSSVDGTRIPGILVSPPDPADGPARMVVNLHGGPHFHWTSGWLGSWVDWAQLLAGRGMTVLLPNPRGSTGRGWEYAHAVRGSLGELPLRDVLDGVDAMIDRGVADSQAVGVGGWSYGGYLTAWAISQTDRFAAAVVGAGISDYFSFLGASPMGPAWEAFVPEGRYPERDPFDAISPITHLGRCTTPTLVAHGSADRKIPVEQARILHRGLQARGVPTELEILAGEGHVIESAAARARLLGSVLTWFDRYLPVP